MDLHVESCNCIGAFVIQLLGRYDMRELKAAILEIGEDE